MTKDELTRNLQYFVDNIENIGISIYVLQKKVQTAKKLDIENDALPELLIVFINSIKDEILENEERDVIRLSASDERREAIYHYDIEVPEELSVIDTIKVSDDHPLFDIQNDDIKDVAALLIEIGDNENQIVLYKTMAPVNIYSRASLFLKKSLHRFQRINDDFFRISANFQMIEVAGSLFVLDLKAIEKLFGFHHVIKKEATHGMKAIEEADLVGNPETLHELIEDVTFARKLTRVAKNSPVLRADIPNNKIISFCKTFPKLKGKIRFNEGEDKIMLDTKVSKNLFVQLLMDDFLTSELTSYYYTSIAKDEALIEAEPTE